jgi:hypothetical protein
MSAPPHGTIAQLLDIAYLPARRLLRYFEDGAFLRDEDPDMELEYASPDLRHLHISTSPPCMALSKHI